MRRLLAILSTTIVIGFGLITLLGLLVGDNLGYLTVFAQRFQFRALSSLFLQLVVITAATTIIIGLLNLLGVHFGRIGAMRRGWPYSLVLILSTLLVIGLTIAERANVLSTTAGQPSPSAILLDSVQVSVESALAALLLFALVYGAYRLMRRRVTWAGILFTLALLVVLVGALPLPGTGLSLLGQVRNWLLAVPVSAGARGILLGIGLATVVTGIRVLIGQDRSYRE